MQSSKFQFRSVCLLAIILSLIMSFSVFAQDTVPFGEPTEGEFTGDPTVYTVDATAGQLIVVRMESEAIDSYVSVEQDGKELASDDDSGGYPDALLAYVAQFDGTYDIVATDGAYTPGEGAYMITIDVIDPSMVEQESSVTLEADAEGSPALYAVFGAGAGDVVDVWATTTGEDDVEMTLYGVDGVQIESDDDDGYDNNALIRRVILPKDGLYLVKVEQSWSDELLFEAVEVKIGASEQLYLSAEPQELVLGDAEGQIGTEVYTVDIEVGKTYRFIVTIESIPDEEAGIHMELLDTAFFFSPDIDVQHSTGVTWDFLANSSGTIRLDVHPTFFGTDISSIDYTIAMEVLEN
jgi:hypothetical protein